MQIREIETADIARAAALLAEGFPGQDAASWTAVLRTLDARPTLTGYPRMGFVVEADGRLEGIILLISSLIDGVVRSNLSSWYVRPDARQYATFLFQRSIKQRGGIYLNLSPSVEALPIAKAFGFKPYTGGVLRFDARSALRAAGNRVRAIDARNLSMLDDAARDTVRIHLGYGCRACSIEDGNGALPIIYRVRRVKRIVPVARIVSGDPARVAASAGDLSRFFLMRGIAGFFIDAPRDIEGVTGASHLPDKDVRYVKGAPAPAPGDLRETEMAIFYQ